MKNVIKRDGRVVPFHSEKIVDAILSAMKETSFIDNTLAVDIADQIALLPSDHSVEEIQDMVESMLMGSERKDVAKRYILYRAERTKQRNLRNEIMKKVLEKTLGQNTENSNANVDERSFGGRKNEAATVIQKSIALDQNMSKDISDAHKNGYIYQHDLDHYNIGAHNCLMLDFKHLYTHGFKTRNCDVRPPSSFSTACQLMAVAFQLQSQCQYGGVGTVHADYDLAPYVKRSFYTHITDGIKYLENPDNEALEESAYTEFKEVCIEHDLSIEDELFSLFPKAKKYAMDMLEREGRQATQALYHNLNTLESRAGSQVPFTSINYGRDISPEGRLVTKWLLETSLDGVGKHHVTSIFPIGIFSHKKGVNANPGDPNYDLKQLAIKSLSKRIYPNICNNDWTEAHEDPNDPDTIFSTMG